MYSKQTKIICTLSPDRCTPELLKELYDEGMNVVRLNTAHLTTEEADLMVKEIRAVSDRIGILIDTKGPEVRTCNIAEPIAVKTGDRVFVTAQSSELPNSFQVNYEHFIPEIKAGSQVLIDDGDLELTVDSSDETQLICTARNDGVIKDKKGLNVPGSELRMPSLTEKDGKFIEWAIKREIDFIAHSFVRNRDDVMAIQSILDMRKSTIKIIAKIENSEGVSNLDSILDVAYAVMVARGDLGIEIPVEEVPVIQKQIIKTCLRRLKPVITATQMLHSMIENPRPTRAEVSDVANAILDGTDTLMLSGETACGKFPLEAVRTMSSIAHSVEKQKQPERAAFSALNENHLPMPGSHLAEAAVRCARQLPIQAIITSTRSGGTAAMCASYRGKKPIFALSEDMHTVRELSLCYGVYASRIDIPDTTDELVKTCLDKLLSEKKIDPNHLIAFLGGGHIYSHHTNFLQIETPATLLKKDRPHS
ncbi:pyruvate kinase [Tichowtungia aerotolerans]|uniref:Pyruvate kinase n=1 Tax=Tichowtungia aerotolerans TaxID=2697043 RepID=A0A6P1M2G7_9BACT|nr:pyruvate kinase [Tichowtungia aerotolerans]QHI69029.1 pyruvate kinase [Tichowtungia aerotolerans]